MKTNIRAYIVENDENVGTIDLELTDDLKIPLSIKTRVGGFTYRLAGHWFSPKGEFFLTYETEFKEDQVLR